MYADLPYSTLFCLNVSKPILKMMNDKLAGQLLVANVVKFFHWVDSTLFAREW